MVKTMCGVQLTYRKTAMDLMLLFSLNEAIEQFDMTNRVHWHCHVLWREWSCVEERTFICCGEDSHVLRNGRSCVEERTVMY